MIRLALTGMLLTLALVAPAAAHHTPRQDKRVLSFVLHECSRGGWHVILDPHMPGSDDLSNPWYDNATDDRSYHYGEAYCKRSRGNRISDCYLAFNFQHGYRITRRSSVNGPLCRVHRESGH